MYILHTMYDLNYNGHTSYGNSYFYCSVHLEELLYGAEHELLAIAKFLVYGLITYDASQSFWSARREGEVRGEGMTEGQAWGNDFDSMK